MSLSELPAPLSHSPAASMMSAVRHLQLEGQAGCGSSNPGLVFGTKTSPLVPWKVTPLVTLVVGTVVTWDRQQTHSLCFQEIPATTNTWVILPPSSGTEPLHYLCSQLPFKVDSLVTNNCWICSSFGLKERDQTDGTCALSVQSQVGVLF